MTREVYQEIDTALFRLRSLRKRYPWLQLLWDSHERRPIARPGKEIVQHPLLVAELKDLRDRIGPLLEWEEKNQTSASYLSPEQEEMMEWLYRKAGPGFWPETIRLWPWTGVVKSIGVLDGLQVEAAMGPAGPSWHRVQQDVARLMQMDREGLL